MDKKGNAGSVSGSSGRLQAPTVRKHSGGKYHNFIPKTRLSGSVGAMLGAADRTVKNPDPERDARPTPARPPPTGAPAVTT